MRATGALGLDIVAFDYSYTPSGELVVWEANPLPFIQFLKRNHRYRARSVERTFAAMAHLYYTRAGLAVPDDVLALLAFETDHGAAEEAAAEEMS